MSFAPQSLLSQQRLIHSGCISQALAYALAQCLACRLAVWAGRAGYPGKGVQRSGQKHNYAFKRTAGREFGVFW
jgi:hypothetical protein